MGEADIVAAGRPIRRPQRRLLELALLSLIAVALVLVGTLRVPVADLKIVRHDNSQVQLSHAGRTLLLPRDTPLLLTPQTGAPIALRADTLVDGIVTDGNRSSKRAWWAQRDQIAAAFAAGPVTLAFADGTSAAAHSRPRRLADLDGAFWASLLTGFAGLLCGMWVLVLRPRSGVAQTFAAMSLGLFGAGCTLAAGYDPLLLGGTYRTLMLLNHACVQIFATGILMLFCRFPTPLVARRWLWGFAAAALILTVVDMADLVGDTIGLVFAAIAAEFVLFTALLLGQAWAVRGDPVGRAAMRLIGSFAALPSALFVGIVILPMLIWGAPLVNEAIALPLFLVIYAGLGAAIARTRLFTVDGWALGLLVSVCAAVAATAADLAILSLVGGSQGVALPIAIVAVGVIYLPLRQSLHRRSERRRNAAARHSLRLASELAFAISAEARAERWRATLAAMFDPLEIAPDPDPAAQLCIADHGMALRLPRIGDVPAFVLRYAQRGARDFDALDIDQAREVLDVIEALMGARDAYVRGVAEERMRIAQDLHDDVSARLLTSLHRQDTGMMRNDVREAVADIRTIVAAYTGHQRQLGELIAELRYETASRLEAHGIALDWPIEAPGGGARAVDYATTRHVFSIVRELVSNIVRHSGACHVAVAIEVAGDRLHIGIGDDGTGFDPAGARGNGLANSARRAELLSGSFTLSPGDPGTVARIDVQLPADTARTSAAVAA